MKVWVLLVLLLAVAAAELRIQGDIGVDPAHLAKAARDRLMGPEDSGAPRASLFGRRGDDHTVSPLWMAVVILLTVAVAVVFFLTFCLGTIGRSALLVVLVGALVVVMWVQFGFLLSGENE